MESTTTTELRVSSEAAKQRAADHIRAAAAWAAERLNAGAHAEVMLSPLDGEQYRVFICPPSDRWDTNGKAEGDVAKTLRTAQYLVTCPTQGGHTLWSGEMMDPEAAARRLTKFEPNTRIAMDTGKVLAEFLNRLATYLTDLR